MENPLDDFLHPDNIKPKLSWTKYLPASIVSSVFNFSFFMYLYRKTPGAGAVAVGAAFIFFIIFPFISLILGGFGAMSYSNSPRMHRYKVAVVVSNLVLNILVFLFLLIVFLATWND